MENKKRITIPLVKGIERDKQNGNNGELNTLVNARLHNNAIRPVQKGAFYCNTSKYAKVIEHTYNDYSHLIGYYVDADNNIIIENFERLSKDTETITIDDISSNEGNIATDGTIVEDNNVYYTDYFDLNKLSISEIYLFGLGDAVLIAAFYDSDKNFVSGITENDGVEVETLTYPSDAAYVRFTLSEDYTAAYITTEEEVELGAKINTLQAILTLDSSEELYDIDSFKNFLIVATSENIYRYLWDMEEDKYELKNLKLDTLPKVELTVTSNTTYDTELQDWGPDELLSEIYEELNTESEDNGRLFGVISYRVVYKLYDDSYFLTTTPRIISPTVVVSDELQETIYNIKFGRDSDDNLRAILRLSEYGLTLKPSDYSELSDYSDLITSVCVFCSKPIMKYDIADIFTSDVRSCLPSDGSEYTGATVLELINDYSADIDETDDWKNLASPDLGWFQVAEIPFDDILDEIDESDEDKEFDCTDDYLELDGFYSDYASCEALTVDDNTHHILTGENVFVYNSRIWINKLKRIFSSNFKMIGGSFYEETGDDRYECKLVIQKFPWNYNDLTIVSDVFYVEFDDINIDGSTYTFTFRLPLIAYPSDNADNNTTIKLYFKSQTEDKWYLLYKNTLKASDNFNYSYSLDLDDSEITNTSSSLYSNTNCKDVAIIVTKDIVLSSDYIAELPTNNSTYTLDLSQVQLSNVDNPFYFASANNYTIGTGEVNFFAVYSDALSEGQFGQYPVLAFTSEGVYALNIGTDDVVIVSVTPISGEIAQTAPMGSSQGIYFCTNEGIFIITGRSTQKISQPLEDGISPIISHSTYNTYSSHSQVCTLEDIILNEVNFLDNLDDYVIGIDLHNKRIIVSAAQIAHSYVFCLYTNTWYIISENYTYFVQCQTKLLGYNETRGLINLSDISDTADSVQVHFRSQIIDFDSIQKKKLGETLLAAKLSVIDSFYASFAVFASNDKVNWVMICGNDRRTGDISDNIQITYSPASYRYFIFSFWGNLDVSTENYFKAIITDVQERYGHRLRGY